MSKIIIENVTKWIFNLFYKAAPYVIFCGGICVYIVPCYRDLLTLVIKWHFLCAATCACALPCMHVSSPPPTPPHPPAPSRHRKSAILSTIIIPPSPISPHRKSAVLSILPLHVRAVCPALFAILSRRLSNRDKGKVVDFSVWRGGATFFLALFECSK